jgi:hypothetical protein
MNAVVLFCTLTAATALSAQWLNYPTAGVPRTPSGIPNLGAPTPRTADGKPDLSGIWQANNVIHCDTTKQNCVNDLPISPHFFNISTGLKDPIPYQAWAADLLKKRVANEGADDPVERCLPAGAPRMHFAPTYKKIVQVPGLLVILDEYNASYRQIFTDARPLPEDPQPSWNGYSSAKWDGDTLVVETKGFRDGLWLDTRGVPLSDAAKVTERFHRVNYGNMEIGLTVDDPKAYTKPWTVNFNQFIVLDTELLDYVCLENEKDASHVVAR